MLRLDGPRRCLAAAEAGQWSRRRWHEYEAWLAGGRRDYAIPYANMVWDRLGLYESGRPSAPAWARGARSFAALGRAVGLLFATDDRGYAERYGEALEVDLGAEQVIDVVDDLHVRAHRAWIVLVRPGAPLPLRNPGRPPPAPGGPAA
jgi:hypothetical protein